MDSSNNVYSPRSYQNSYTPGGSVLKSRVKSTTNKDSNSFAYEFEGGSYGDRTNNDMPMYYNNDDKSKHKNLMPALTDRKRQNRIVTAIMSFMMFGMVVFCFQTTSFLSGKSSQIQHEISKQDLQKFQEVVTTQNSLFIELHDEEIGEEVENKKMANNVEGVVSKDVQHIIRHAGISKGLYPRARRSDTNPKRSSLSEAIFGPATGSSPLSKEDLDNIADSANQLKGYLNPQRKAKQDYRLPRGYGITGKVSSFSTIEEFEHIEFDEEDHFGQSLAVLGDINKDGYVDVAIGAPGADFYTGAIYIASLNKNGQVVSYRYISPTAMMDQWNVWGEQDAMGYALENIGDLDGDGINELAVSAISFPSGENVGEVFILFLQRDFRVRKHTKITSNMNGFDFTLKQNTHFGTSLANLGDIDGDGVQDLMVGAVGMSQYRGGAFILNLNKDGTVKSYTQLSSSHNMPLKLQPDDEFGISCQAIGDLDGDGIQEIIIGAESYPNGEAFGTGFILWLDSDGTAKKVRRIDELDGELDGEDFLGGAYEAIGDLDGDGISEIAVSAHGMVDYEGAFFIMYMDKDGKVKEYTRISTDEGLPLDLDFEDEFAKSIVSLGPQYSKSGKVSLVVGSLGHPGGDKQGIVYVIHLDKERA